MTRWLVKDSLLINLVLIVLCFLSNGIILSLLSFWTDARWSEGEKGGILDHRLFGISVLYHIVQDRLEAVFFFPDTTAYLFALIIIFNAIILFLNLGFHIEFELKRIRNYALLNILVAFLCLRTYMWMMDFISGVLGTTPYGTKGGVVEYSFLSYSLYPVDKGRLIYGYDYYSLDFTALTLILLLLLTVVTILYRSKDKPVH